LINLTGRTDCDIETLLNQCAQAAANWVQDAHYTWSQTWGANDGTSHAFSQHLVHLQNKL
jgi:hypothetical protein